jgi:hypothetical protein
VIPPKRHFLWRRWHSFDSISLAMHGIISFVTHGRCSGSLLLLHILYKRLDVLHGGHLYKKLLHVTSHGRSRYLVALLHSCITYLALAKSHISYHIPLYKYNPIYVSKFLHERIASNDDRAKVTIINTSANPRPHMYYNLHYRRLEGSYASPALILGTD